MRAKKPHTRIFSDFEEIFEMRLSSQKKIK